MENAIISEKQLHNAQASSPAATIFMTFDENYAPYAQVALFSLLINTSNRDFTIDIYTFGLNSELEAGFRRLGRQFGVSIRHVVVDPSIFQSLPVYHQVTSATYLRLYVTDKIATDYALYLDPDLIVQTDIARLLEEVSTIELIAGIDQGGGNDVNGNNKTRLGLSADQPYINTGVLGIKLSAWKQLSVWTTALQTYQQQHEKIKWWDQDILNLMFNNKFHLLDQKWNLSRFNYGDYETFCSGFDIAAFDGIFHYLGRVKPWMVWSNVNEKALFDRYADLLPLDKKYIKRPSSMQQALMYTQALENAGDYRKSAEIKQGIIERLTANRNPRNGNAR